MINRFKQFIMLRVFPTGRRLFALKQVRATAEAAGLTELSAWLDQAISADAACLMLERAWRSQTGASTARGAAQKVDQQVDRLLSAITNRLNDLVRSLPSEHPTAIAAEAFLSRWFPDGVRATTHLPFEEELEEVEGLLEEIGTDESKIQLQLLGIDIYVDQLHWLLPQYRTEISNLPPKDLTYSMVVKARDNGQTKLLATIARILAFCDDEALAETREKLLAPILDQDQRLADATKVGRKSPDIDPDTGADVI